MVGTLTRACTLIIATVAASSVSAGAYMESTRTATGGDAKKPEVMKMWFDGGRFRAESGTEQVQIFDGKQIHVIDVAQKRYTTIDKASIDEFSGKLANLRSQMEAQMKNMPPEQRAMVEQMMSQMGGTGAQAMEAAKRSVKQTGRSESAAGHSCKVWEVTVGGVKEQELCVVAPGSLPGGTDMMATMVKIGEMFKSLMESFGGAGRDALSQAWSDLQAINGIPVITRLYDNGRLSEEVKLTVIRSESVPATRFQIPAGYQQRKLNLGSGG